MSSEAGSDEVEQAPVPRLRFPEFRDAGAWTTRSLGSLLSIGNGQDHQHLSEGDIPVYGSGGYMRSVNRHIYEGESVCIGRKGTIDCPTFLTGKFWTVDTLFYTHSFIDLLPKFAFYIFQNIRWKEHCEAGGVPSLSKWNIERIRVAVPEISEQQKIAECLESLDAAIEEEGVRLTVLKNHKKGLMQILFPAPGETSPRLRFPEFREAGGWKEKALGEIINTVTPPKKLQTSQYGISGKFPIIDQSQDPVAGWTNDAEASITDGLPLIIFGDHTCVLKLVSEPFVQGADGIKIMRTNGEVSVEFVYQSLLNEPMQMENYKRHFSKLKERRVSYPDRTTSEQRRIADCLSSFDDAVKATSDKAVGLKRHKAALMQQLFPVSGTRV